MWVHGCAVHQGAVCSLEKASTPSIHNPSPNQTGSLFTQQGAWEPPHPFHVSDCWHRPRLSCLPAKQRLLHYTDADPQVKWVEMALPTECLLSFLFTVMLETVGLSGKWVCPWHRSQTSTRRALQFWVPEVAYFSLAYTESGRLSLVNMDKVQSKNKHTKNNSCL